ncbi:Detected protein of unknown function [Hibiscus syriacus]|uniref:Uncharacterized protein n=1 Tax=Hibiscus syriacus TaxID=106335 RepID=A0A6A2WSK3_HIBSY|nr:Detected protein of unknown function [Hibiscus syriacus]
MQEGNQVGEKMSREKSRRANLPPVQENIDKLEKVIKDELQIAGNDLLVYVAWSSGCMSDTNHVCDALVKGKIPCEEVILDRIRKIYKLFPQIPVASNLAVDDDVQQLTEAIGEAKTRLQGCSSFLKAAIKWSAEFGDQKNGDPQLHTMLAEYIYSESPDEVWN